MGSHRGILSRAEGCWTFDARDRIPRSSRLSVHPFTAAAENTPTDAHPSRESGFVLLPHFGHWLTPAASQFLVKPIIEALSLHADCGLRRVSSASMALAKL